jgi:hypothetical protein
VLPLLVNAAVLLADKQLGKPTEIVIGLIQNITRTASSIDQNEPGFADKFHPPKAYNPTALLTTTDAFLLQLAEQPAKTTLVAKFVAHEMDASFVTHLQADRQPSPIRTRARKATVKGTLRIPPSSAR